MLILVRNALEKIQFKFIIIFILPCVLVPEEFLGGGGKAGSTNSVILISFLDHFFNAFILLFENISTCLPFVALELLSQ